MRVLVLFFLIHISIKGYAQDFPSELWHKGKIVLLSEDTIIGKIKYDLQNDVIQVNVRNVFIRSALSAIRFCLPPRISPQVWDRALKTPP